MPLDACLDRLSARFPRHSFPIDSNSPFTDRDADARHNQHEIMLEPSPNVHLEKDDSYLPEVWVRTSFRFSRREIDIWRS